MVNETLPKGADRPRRPPISVAAEVYQCSLKFAPLLDSLKDDDLDPLNDIDPVVLLCAISLNESSGGKWNVPKHENAYAPGGVYYKKSVQVRELYGRYGALAACSWSSWQILYVTAVELGFKGSPLDLWNDSTAIEWVVKLLNARIIRTGKETLAQIADAFNSGNYLDGLVPREYIDKLKRHYNLVLREMRGAA